MELSDDQSTHTANDEYGRLNPNSLLGGLFFVVSLVFLFYVIPMKNIVMILMPF